MQHGSMHGSSSSSMPPGFEDSRQQQEQAPEAADTPTVFSSDTILIRVLDESAWTLDLIYNFLTSEGDLQFIDFSFFSFSKSICASFYDTRHAVGVSAKLQRLPGISSCIWKSSSAPDARVARVPLLFSAVALDPLQYALGDIDSISVEEASDSVKVVFFDSRAKTRLIARLADLTASLSLPQQ